MESTLFWSTAALFISLISSYFTWLQGRDIWEYKTSEGVSSIWMIYFSVYFLGNLVYGFHISDPPIIINGIIRTLVYGYAAVGIYNYGVYGTKERVVLGMTVVGVILLALLPEKGYMIVALSIGSVLAVSSQPMLLFKKKKRGVLRLDVLVVFSVSTVFWLIYTYIIEDPFLFSIMCAFSVLLIVTFILYARAEPSAKSA